MGVSSKRVVVTVNGRDFLVEIEDLEATPVIAVVDGESFEVSVGKYVTERKTESAMVGDKQQGDEPLRQTSEKQPPTLPSDYPGQFRVTAPMPGDIVEVFVQPGQMVREGDSLCVLDAMKMKNVIHSPREGRIASVQVSRGQSVEYGDPIVTFE